MTAASADRLELVRWRVDSATSCATPTDGGSVFPQSAGVVGSGGDGPEEPRGFRPHDAEAIAPTDDALVVTHTAGEKEFDIEATNLRGVIKAMDARFPGIAQFLEEETTVAIDGEIHETAYFQPLRDGCEVYFLPKIEAG